MLRYKRGLKVWAILPYSSRLYGITKIYILYLTANEGAVDCLWGCFTMTDREDKYNWAGPYMYSRQIVVVNKDSGIENLADLKGKEWRCR